MTSLQDPTMSHASPGSLDQPKGEGRRAFDFATGEHGRQGSGGLLETQTFMSAS